MSKDVQKPKKQSALIQDGWKNIITGMGTGKDKSVYSTLDWRQTDQATAEGLFSGDEIGSKIARIIPYDGTREGVAWNMDDSDDQKEVVKFVESEFDRLKVWKNFMWGWTLARAYGGAILYMSIKDGRRIDQPVNWKRVKKIDSLKAMDRWELNFDWDDLIDDLGDPKFGTPQIYKYQPSSVRKGGAEIRIHHSRVIRFDGVQLPSRLYVQNNHWHDSIYGALSTAIRNYGVTHDAISPIIQSIAQPVYKVEGLSDALAMDQDELVIKKLQQVELMRSTSKAIILDKEDEFTTVAQNVTGGKDLAELVVQRLVAGADIPHTRLLGESPSGLGATGQSELINYYDSVKSMQEDKLRDPIDTILDVIFAQAGAEKRPSDLAYKFNPLFQLDQESEIKARMMQAKIDKDYFDMGALFVEEITQSRFGTGRYSYETVIDPSKERIAGGEERPAEVASEKRRKDRSASTVGQPTAGLATGQKTGEEEFGAL